MLIHNPLFCGIYLLAKQSEDLIKAMEKERDVKHSEATQKLESVRAEMEWKLHRLEPRERKAEAMVGKVIFSLCKKKPVDTKILEYQY